MRVTNRLESSYTPPTTPQLTPGEWRVAELVAAKWTTKRIAAELGVLERRVNTMLAAIAWKTNVQPGEHDRVHVAVWFRETGHTLRPRI